MSERLNYEQLFKLVKEIQGLYFGDTPYDNQMRQFQDNVSYPDVEQLFRTDQNAEYILKRAFHHKVIKFGELHREELIHLVEQVMECAGEEWEIDIWLDMVTSSVADPNISDYIFWSDEALTAEEIVDKALLYKPIF
ncbi:e9imm peptide [Lysinibacillus sp. G4S2]|uniref:e9imm peptide n=1 Tax=Lysinibacillus sp. G4S2 TaxID=3055859 RepID=UPI0025A2AB6F|nr:e9imm peptide [Lysinibacillus sp. G4S2]MDM5247790.1 e9imm peptide [Lysinibacillus sp. G4S2]